LTGNRAHFTRQTADVRRHHLIDATIACLHKHGAGGLSVRNIAAEAGVSPGLVAHHFDGVEALIAETYRDVAARVGAVCDQAVRNAGPEPRARLVAFLTASFSPPVRDAAIFSAWVAFWSLSQTSEAVALSHRHLYADYRAQVEALLAECGLAAPRLRMAAVAATALVDGLWLELCLDDSVFTALEARQAAEGWIDALLRKET
jgi:TetR/AcrR family transcriptional repressor of bet genes